MKKLVNRIEENMTEYPAIASRETSVNDAYAFMAEMEFRHLPVVEGDKVVGVVSERDLRQVRLFADPKVTIGDVMTPDPYTVTEGTQLSTVAAEMAAKKYGCAVVLNWKGKVVGIFTTTDALRLLSDILNSKGGGEIRQWAVGQYLSSGPWVEALSDAGL